MYDVSDREREAPRIPRRNQGPGMDKLATHLEEQTLISQSSLAPRPNSSELDDSVAGRLAEQLYSFHGCPSDAHDACDDEYTQSPDSHTLISDLLHFQKPGGSIPNVLE